MAGIRKILCLSLLTQSAISHLQERQTCEQSDRQVYQIQDGQVQVQSSPVSQISDGQVQVPSSYPTASPSFSDAVSSYCPDSAATLAPVVTLGCGIVTGTTTALPSATAIVNKFLGVPFAQSPPQRFSPPQRASTCNVEAKEWKAACIQQFIYPKVQQEFVELIFNNPPPKQESEDCLYLNVYAPSSPPPPGGRAVMYWIYGGSLQFGNAGQIYYDGSSFAAYEDVIVVTVNYRTNVFGFPTTPELPVTEQNLGFLDQRAGLAWVQEHVAAFGGSPSKVTIFGESAGAFSVDALLTSYPRESTPPFRAAIMESGQISYASAPRTSTVDAWNNLAELLQCPGTYGSNLACLRAANATVIKDTIEENILLFNPVGDNVTLVTNPLQQRLSGNIAHIPVLAGSNAQEGRVFALGQTNTTAYVQTLVGNNSAALIEQLENAYPPYNTSATGIDAYEQSAMIRTDITFGCPADFLLRETRKLGIPAWRYYFNASFTNTQGFPGLGVYHASEIPIVWSTYNHTNVTVQQYALSESMRGAWARFAKNPAGGPGWNQVGTGMGGDVLSGAMAEVPGAIYTYVNGSIALGTWDLGVFGNVGDVSGSGVTVIDPAEVDKNCALYEDLYVQNAAVAS